MELGSVNLFHRSGTGYSMELGSVNLFHRSGTGYPMDLGSVNLFHRSGIGYSMELGSVNLFFTDQVQGIPWNSAQLTYSIGQRSSTECPTRHDGSKTTCNSCCFL